MKKFKWVIILINLAIILFSFNYSVATKETILKEGKLILLELAPDDSRSVLQGDFMLLKYTISRIETDSISKRGYCVVRVDSIGIAERVRVQAGLVPLNKGEFLIEYNIAGKGISIGAEAFFLEEGQSEKYLKARYGALKVDKAGNSILVGLYDEKRELIK